MVPPPRTNMSHASTNILCIRHSKSAWSAYFFEICLSQKQSTLEIVKLAAGYLRALSSAKTR